LLAKAARLGGRKAQPLRASSGTQEPAKMTGNQKEDVTFSERLLGFLTAMEVSPAHHIRTRHYRLFSGGSERRESRQLGHSAAPL